MPFSGKIAALVSLIAAGAAVPAVAHDHMIQRNGQIIANSQNHPRFIGTNGVFMACESFGAIPGDTIGSAWYGLEVAHHGQDATGAGKSDGCYMIEGGLSPLNPLSDRNPAIQCAVCTAFPAVPPRGLQVAAAGSSNAGPAPATVQLSPLKRCNDQTPPCFRRLRLPSYHPVRDRLARPGSPAGDHRGGGSGGGRDDRRDRRTAARVGPR